MNGCSTNRAEFLGWTTAVFSTEDQRRRVATRQDGDGDAKKLISFKFDQILDAYATFGAAADTHALKVLIEL
jgi:alcohol dehydrogenase